MYAICRTTHQPTEIEHSLYCHFYNRKEHNLITAGVNQLKVFRVINEIDEDSQQPSSESSDNATLPGKIRLECCQSFSLFGNIMSIESVTLSGSSRDSLLIGFADAKLSIVEYDPNTHDLKTLSLHYFEEDEMRTGYTQFVHVPIVRADPDGRCAAFLVYNRNIIILPFQKDIIADDNETTSTQTQATATSTILGTRSPVLASYKLDLNTEQYGDRINNIIDIQFLYNYYEPTLLILYEPIQTWAGRVAVRQDTCAMLVLSLNVQQRVHPHIWSLSHLPYDCFRAMPVPKPVGGVLIFANNSLIHLNQGLPPYGVSLNGFTDGSTSFPLKQQDDLKISLDCSLACFISSEKLVISLKNGDLYVLNLFNDMTRSIRGFHFDKAASSVLPTCMTLCGNEYLFLGSRLGHSLLLHFTEKPICESDKQEVEIDGGNENEKIPNSSDAHVIGDYDDDLYKTDEQSKVETNNSNEENSLEKEEEENSRKRIKLENEVAEENEKPAEESIGNWFAGDVALIEDPDIFEVYKTTDTKVVNQDVQTKLSFEVCDSIINIGPCTRTCMGETALLADEFSVGSEPDVEIVTTCGYAKNGALGVLQRTLRPQIVTTFELPGCVDMWTVYGSQAKTNEKQEEPKHAFLILSRQEATMILQTGQELNELDQSGFSTQTSTVFAGNLGQFIIQVSQMGVRLLDGTRELQHFPIDVGSPICFTSIADPYAVLMSQNGVILLLCLKLESSNPRLIISRPELSTAKSKIISLCVYKDVSGIFTTEKKIIADQNEVKKETKQEKTKQNTNQIPLPIPSSVDEEDEMLYGESEIDISKPFIVKPDAKEQEQDFTSKVKEIRELTPTYWLFIVRENGVMEVFSLPDFKLVYLVKNFPMAPKILVDSVQVTDHIGTQQQPDTISSMPITRELLVTGMGVKKTRPILFARFDDEVIVYEAFSYIETQVDNHLKLRFKKLPHSVILKEPKFGQQVKVESENPETSSDIPTTTMWLRCFSDISNYSGVFLCGPYPHWFLMSYRGEMRVHQMNIDGPVVCFSTFNNLNCPKGFLYFNKNNELRICTLTKHLNYDAQWPVRKVPLRCTPHFLNYHVDSKTYCVVTSVQEEVTKIVRVGGEEKDYDVLETENPRYIAPISEKFSLHLVSPVSWEMIPGTKIELEEWEHVTCLKNVMLASEGTSTGLKGYIAMGTNYNYGEDVTNRGRIWILDIIEVVPEPGQPLTKNKIKIVYSKEQKGPVTALCQVRGFLLTAIGQKLYIWQLKEAQLIGIAFIDTQIYVHSAISLKNLILIADVYKSISLLRYQEETRTLSLVSKDQKALQVYACDYLIDNSQMCFIISDAEKNFVLYNYQPDARESYGGTRLLRRADYHFGSHVNAFFRVRCRLPLKDIDKRLRQTIFNRHVTMFASLDGSLGYIMPITEKTYRRLLMLQNVLTVSLQHLAGLNPKAYRILKCPKNDLLNPSKNIIDGDLLAKFLTLSMNEKLEFSKKIGTTPNQIISDLHEINLLASYF